MKNILFVSNSGDMSGGGEISLADLVKGIDKARYRAFVVCPSEGGFFSSMSRSCCQVSIIWMPSLRGAGVLFFPLSVIRFLRFIRTHRIDLVHANGSRCMIYSGIAARLCGVPVVWHVRVMESDLILDRFLASLSTRIVVNSQAVSRRFFFLSERREKVSVVYNGVDLSEFAQNISGDNIRREFEIGPDENVICHVGRLVEYKGHRTFLEAVKRVVEEVQDVRVLIVGEGELEQELKDLSQRLSLTRYVIFCGYRKDIPQVMAASTILVLSSVGEHFGRVLIEAMAMGKPVVATRGGGVPEIVIDGRTGILVEPQDPDMMAQGILTLLKDPLLSHTLGKEGYRRVVERFSLHTHVNEVEKIYESLLNKEGVRNREQRSCAKRTHHIYVPYRPCTLCSAQTADILQEAEDPYRVVKCYGCGLVFVDPIPPREELAEHYNASYYSEWISTQVEARRHLWEARMCDVKRYKREGLLLDVGCGDGAFLEEAQKQGFEACGTEVSEYAVKRARAIIGKEIFLGDFREARFSDSTFDAVTMWHVLEHVADPRGYLIESERVLKEGGILIVAVPNVNSYLFNFFYRLWKGQAPQLFSRDAKEIHLYHFSPRTLTKMLDTAGFRVISLSVDSPDIDLRKRVVDFPARGVYSLTRKNWSMAMRAIAMKVSHSSGEDHENRS